MARDLAIDLGTANTVVYARGEGIVLDEPSVLVLDTRTREVLAMGREAWAMLGRTPGSIEAVRPLRQGAIDDFDVAQRLIRLILKQAGLSRLSRPRVVMCVPSSITEVERRAVLEAARRAGAAEAQLIGQPVAAAIGAGLPINEPVGSLVVDIGGGTTECVLMSLGGVVGQRALRVGSFDIDAAIQNHIRREHGIQIGERTAEQMKHSIAAALDTGDELRAEVRGRELMTGMARTAVVSRAEMVAAIDEQVSAIVGSVIDCLSDSPPDLANDLIEQGIHLVGGGSLLTGLDQRMANDTGLRVRRVDDPLGCTVTGAGLCLERAELLDGMLQTLDV